MNLKYSNTENEDGIWMSFKQYRAQDREHSENSHQWTEQDISALINKTFTTHLNERDTDNCTHTKTFKLDNDNITYTNANKDTQLNDNNDMNKVYCNNTPEVDKFPINEQMGYFNDNRTFENNLFQRRSSKEYWERLSLSASKKKSPKKIVSRWKESYINVLPLHNNSTEKNPETSSTKSTSDNWESKSWSRSSSSDRCSLTSEESDNDFSEESMRRSDPMYSKFGEINDSFHTSEDGVVFNTQKELEIYKSKMAGMKEVFRFELELIKYQHDKLLQAKRAEERKLLRMNSHDIHEEEPSEKDGLNTESNKQIPPNKQERKSALFSSITDAFSYARTGIQGMFVKNSPSGSRKMRTQNEYSDSSDDEEEKLGATLLSKNPDSLVDNHDEFTRKMASEGGLKYKGSDKTDQQLSYQNLPPPLSLTSLQAKAKT